MSIEEQSLPAPQEQPLPEPCLRCGSVLALSATPRNELFCYTARLSVRGSRLETAVDQEPRGRLCEACTRAFGQFLKMPSKKSL